jgi:hypothetical protein
MDPGMSASDLFRPKWPYPLGMIAGLVFGFGMAAFTYQLLSDDGGMPSAIPLVIVALGAGALGVAWFGIFKMDQGGFGPAAGSIAIALAVAYMLSLKRERFDELLASAIMLFGAFAFCGLGHAFAKGAGFVRTVGAIAGLAIAFLLVAMHEHWNIGKDGIKMCFVLGFGGLAVVGFGAAYAFYKLSTAKIVRSEF